MAASQRPLSPEQVDLLAREYGLHLAMCQSLVSVVEGRHGIFPVDTLPVRDGTVEKGAYIWWRCEDGPQQVVADDKAGTWDNIRQYPELFSIAKPKWKYED